MREAVDRHPIAQLESDMTITNERAFGAKANPFSSLILTTQRIVNHGVQAWRERKTGEAIGRLSARERQDLGLPDADIGKTRR